MDCAEGGARSQARGPGAEGCSHEERLPWPPAPCSAGAHGLVLLKSY